MTTFKDSVRSARAGLGRYLVGFEEPPRRPLSVEPLLAASCLRVGLRHGHVPLALAAGATLLVFDPERLWRVLLASAGVDHGLTDLTPGLAVLAVRKDLAWRRRSGGDWRVASCLIGQVGVLSPSELPARLWQASFLEPPPHNRDARGLVSDARDVRLGFQRTPGRANHSYERALAVLDRHEPGGGIHTAFSCTLWPTLGEGPALMLPLLVHGGSTAAGAPPAYSDDPLRTSLEAVLTHRTPAGRQAIRAIVKTLPAIAALQDAAGLSDSEMVDAVGELLERRDLALRQSWRPYGMYREVAQWAGVPFLSGKDARAVGQLIEAQAAVVADIRRQYLPSPLTNFELQQPSGGPRGEFTSGP